MFTLDDVIDIAIQIEKNGEKIYLDNEVSYLPDTEWHKGLGSYSTVKKDY